MCGSGLEWNLNNFNTCGLMLIHVNPNKALVQRCKNDNQQRTIISADVLTIKTIISSQKKNIKTIIKIMILLY